MPPKQYPPPPPPNNPNGGVIREATDDEKLWFLMTGMDPYFPQILLPGQTHPVKK